MLACAISRRLLFGMEQSNGEGHQDLRHKRKAESHDNERLSKRLSLLNIGMLPYFSIESDSETNSCFSFLLRRTRRHQALRTGREASPDNIPEFEVERDP